MTIYVNKQEAEQQFSQLLSQVLQGEEIIISIEGQEMARLIPFDPNKVVIFPEALGMRVPGIDRGRFVVSDDFDDPLPSDLIKAFEGKN
ncbi:MAG: type II toxin-antitoxin system prevent-host-death family antitoxin [Microcoleaceae cyanobacterium]